MAGWINMPLGMEVGLRADDFVLDGNPAPAPPKWGRVPHNFWPMSIEAKRLDGSRWHLACRWASVKAIERGIAPTFGPCLLWPNGWMDQDVTWYEGRPQPRPHCVKLVPSSPPPFKNGRNHQFYAHVHCGQMVTHLSYC